MTIYVMFGEMIWVIHNDEQKELRNMIRNSYSV